MSEFTSQKRRNYMWTGIVAGALLLSGCGGSETYGGEPTLRDARPTAVELSKRDKSIVSEFPSEGQGFEGADRFCREIGGEVTSLADNHEMRSIGCDIKGISIELSLDGDSRYSVAEFACLKAGGEAVRVAIKPGSQSTVSACNLPGVAG